MRGVCGDEILAIVTKLCGRWILGDVSSVGLSYQNLLREWPASIGEDGNFQCQSFIEEIVDINISYWYLRYLGVN